MRRFLFLALLCFFSQANAEELRVGVILPLSGAMSASGLTARNSLELAQSRSNARVRYLYEDDSFEPKNSVTAARKLISIEKVHALIVWGTPTSLAVSDLAEKQQVPLIAISMLEQVVRGKKFVMKHWIPSPTIHEKLSFELLARNIRRVAVVTLINDAMLDLKERMIDDPRFHVVFSSDHVKGDLDFRTTVSKLRNTNPQGVYVLLWSPQLHVFARQLREAGYQGSVFGTQNMEDRNEILAATGALDGAWFVGVDEAPHYAAEYQSKFGSAPVAGGANFYDIALMLANCAEESSDLNRCLHSLRDFTGLLGTYSATTDGSFSLQGKTHCIQGDDIAPCR